MESLQSTKETAADHELTRDADVNAVDKDGFTSLHWASWNNSKETAAELVQRGADINAVDKDGETPLHYASRNNSKETAAELIQRGADINAVDKNGYTPLNYASRNNSKETASELIQRGADINTVDKDSYTPLLYASRNNSEETAAELMQRGADINAVDKYGKTPLHYASRNNSKETAAALMQRGADINAVDKDDDTPLHWALKNYSKETATELIQRGADINAVNMHGDTPLHWALKNYSKETATELIQSGADIYAVNKHGVSCYDIAEGVPELSELLKKLTAIWPRLLKWSDPKSKRHRQVIAQVVQHQNSLKIEWFHYHKTPIGSGYFGHVFAGVDARDGREIAVKRIDKHRLNRQQYRREISNLTMIQDCAEIMHYFCYHEDENFVFLILELMEGTLIDYLSSEERDVSNNVTLCRDVIKGLSFLHQKGILHRDIKPGNILYKLYPRICLKLADFGLSSKPVNSTSSTTFSVMHTAAGTRCWMAPELLHAAGGIKHSEASDVFACGLVLHFLLAEKQHPFTNPSSTTQRGSIAEQNEIEQAVLKCELFFYKDLTPEAVDLLKRMMVKNESERPKAADTLYHPFFWSEAKGKEFIVAVGNQPDLQSRGGTSPVEQDLENTLGKQREVSMGWENCIPTIYVEMTNSGRGRRSYDTYSAVALLRFVRNCYAHASDQHRTPQVQNLILRDRELFNKFPTMIIDVYRAVIAHGWDKRIEIENALKTE